MCRKSSVLRDHIMHPPALHAEMREGLLSESSDYASRPLRDQLKRT